MKEMLHFTDAGEEGENKLFVSEQDTDILQWQI